MSKHSNTLIVDIETTSSDRYRAGIVEIGAAWLSGDREAFTLKCRPDPDAPVEEGALAVNGCDWLEDPTKASEAEALQEFADFIRHTRCSRDGPILMMGWNVAVFDWIILQRAWVRYLAEPWPFTFATLDLQAMAFLHFAKEGWPLPTSGLRSAEACEMFGIAPEEKPHRAAGGVAFEYAIAQILLCD